MPFRFSVWIHRLIIAMKKSSLKRSHIDLLVAGHFRTFDSCSLIIQQLNTIHWFDFVSDSLLRFVFSLFLEQLELESRITEK